MTAPPWLSTLLVLGTVAAAVFSSADARAQCDANPGAVLETFPASGSHAVPLNGVAMVLYCDVEETTVDRRRTRLLEDLGLAGVGCACSSGECVQLGALDHCLLEVPADLEIPLDPDGEEGNEVWLQTERELAAATTYVIEAPESSGNVHVSFATGDVIDTQPPRFGGLTSLTVVGCGAGFPSNAACPSQLEEEEGFTAILGARAASDESGLVNIEYRAYQVRDGEHIERSRIRGDGVGDVTMSVFVSADELTSGEWERLCFTMTANDFYGHEVFPEGSTCAFTPEYSPFASMCSVAAAAPGGRGVAVPWLIAALLVGVSVFSRRSRRR